MKKSGHTILITGGSSGIGFALSKQFIQAGNTVITCARNIDFSLNEKDLMATSCAAITGLF